MALDIVKRKNTSPSDTSSRQSSSEGGSHAAHTQRSSPPAFLLKTFEIISDNRNQAIISWSARGTSFVVHDIRQFAAQILPKSFKHNNFASFVRQLNIYGFHKVHSTEWEFQHEHFIRGHPELMTEIKRRHSNDVAARGKIEELSHENHDLIDELNALRDQNAALQSQVAGLTADKQRLAAALADSETQQAAMKTKLQHIVCTLAKLNEEEKAQGASQKKRRVADSPSISSLLNDLTRDRSLCLPESTTESDALITDLIESAQTASNSGISMFQGLSEEPPATAAAVPDIDSSFVFSATAAATFGLYVAQQQQQLQEQQRQQQQQMLQQYSDLFAGPDGNSTSLDNPDDMLFYDEPPRYPPASSSSSSSAAMMDSALIPTALYSAASSMPTLAPPQDESVTAGKIRFFASQLLVHLSEFVLARRRSVDMLSPQLCSLSLRDAAPLQLQTDADPYAFLVSA